MRLVRESFAKSSSKALLPPGPQPRWARPVPVHLCEFDTREGAVAHWHENKSQ
jgi:hypothetical protein